MAPSKVMTSEASIGRIWRSGKAAAKAAKASDDDEEDDSAKPQEALVGAGARKALPGPKDKKDKGSPGRSGSVPGVPRNKNKD